MKLVDTLSWSKIAGLLVLFTSIAAFFMLKDKDAQLANNILQSGFIYTTILIGSKTVAKHAVDMIQGKK